MKHLSTFHEHWSRTVRRAGPATFLLFQDETGTTAWTYAEFDAIVARTAGTLRTLGVVPGASVHVVLRNCPGFLAVWLAVARLGAWLVPADPASSPRDIAVQIRRTRPVAGVCAAARADRYRRGAGEALPHLIELRENVGDVGDGGALVAGPPITGAAGGIKPADRLAVMFTSGTTSEPKGVVLSQENYSTVAETMAAAAALRSEHRWLVTLPLFHANAQYYCFAPAISAGASVALTHAFSASRWVRQARELRATHASLFAAPIRMILARCGAEPPRLHLRHVWFAQSLGRDHHQRFSEIAGCRPRQLYGMTETVAAVTADTSLPARHDIIGGPLAGREIAVADAGTGKPVGDGVPGMLLVRGVRGRDLFAGYLDDPATTGRSFTDLPDGTSWFRTGDLVGRDAATGELRFVGRADDVIKVAGENVSLSEVESVLAQAPKVLEAAVVAQRDPIRDQVPVAYVVPADALSPPDVGALAEWAADNLPPAARPRAWHVIAELPRTSVGKVRRFQIGESGRAVTD
ncbi:class I adenylate-forming enzyme family protein [Amycolatopsis rubida]|uniref:Crotonobetaine/carnitine-CoA ligase n=1 Tax=Amycolatopsis rubida TaxID=112413 RepID=A0A1I5ZGK6_9PSEU|nr:AMP-binding protein [Amycolatopsis rubida]SFQ55247.1 crotonobetaine/carnitine-CoA ligase [Amycolatopsis rubida]